MLHPLSPWGSRAHPGVITVVPALRREVRSPRAMRLSEWSYSSFRSRREPGNQGTRRGLSMQRTQPQPQTGLGRGGAGARPWWTHDEPGAAVSDSGQEQGLQNPRSCLSGDNGASWGCGKGYMKWSLSQMNFFQKLLEILWLNEWICVTRFRIKRVSSESPWAWKAVFVSDPHLWWFMDVFRVWVASPPPWGSPPLLS